VTKDTLWAMLLCALVAQKRPNYSTKEWQTRAAGAVSDARAEADAAIYAAWSLYNRRCPMGVDGPEHCGCEACDPHPGHSKGPVAVRCPNCQGDVLIRNPTGSCDHLLWPEFLAAEARKKIGPVELARIQQVCMRAVFGTVADLGAPETCPDCGRSPPSPCCAKGLTVVRCSACGEISVGGEQ
jgi:hypothetical protein